MEGTTALDATEESCCAACRRTALLFSLVLVAVPAAFAQHSRGRWSFPLNATFSISWLPGPLLDQVQQPNGMNNLFALTLDPAFDVVRRPRWGVYATAGGGLSTKDVVLLAPDPTCNGNDYIGCYNSTASESSIQPAVDAGIGFSFRARPYSRIEFYQETRYMDMFTPSGEFVGFGTAGTGFLEATFGIRINEWHGPDPSRTTH
jgi:hypothetical protein